MIKRLRPKWSGEKIAEIYGGTYYHDRWNEHINRVRWTTDRLNFFLDQHTSDIVTVNDLSCGDGAILKGLIGPTNRVYGDITKSDHLDVTGPIEETIERRRGDLLICSETLEHLDDPAFLLNVASSRFKWICITTPLGEDEPGKNEEHYWGWDLWGISSMLSENGWTPKWVDTLNQPYYTYQLWIARSMWD